MQSFSFLTITGALIRFLPRLPRFVLIDKQQGYQPLNDELYQAIHSGQLLF